MRPRTRLFLALAVALGAVTAAAGRPRRQPAPPACPDPEIRIVKHQSKLALRCGGGEARTFVATFGANPQGHKERQGDERTPEGTYRIASKTRSKRFHRFLALDYPNAEDRRRARERGIADPGRGIGIHGAEARLAGLARLWLRLGEATKLSRLWGPTDGCIGIANEDVELLYDAVPVGTRVVIEP